MPVEDCSRSRSRVARALIRQRGLVPRGGRDSALPAGCPLRRDVDLFADQEDHKKAVRHNVWRCRFCGKAFVSEAWLDAHMARSHGDTLTSNATAYCLGDLCDVLDCAASPHLANSPLDRDARDRDDDRDRDRERRRKRRGRAFKRSAALATSCDDASLEAAKARCRDVLRTCYPPEGGRHAGLCEPRCSNGRVLVERATRAGKALLDDAAASDDAASPKAYFAFLLLFYAGLFYAFSQRKHAAKAYRKGPPPKRAARKD